jgi:hypothetical protein
VGIEFTHLNPGTTFQLDHRVEKSCLGSFTNHHHMMSVCCLSHYLVF